MNWLIAWALSAALMALAVLAIRALLKGKLSLRARYALWAILAVRLLVPVQLPFSLPVALPALDLPAPQSQQASAGVSPGGEVTHISPSAGNFAQTPGQVQTENNSAPAPAPSRIVPLGTALTALWALGAAAVLGAVAVSNGRFSRKLRRVRRPLEAEDCPLPVYVAESLPSPCLAGIFRPAVYLTPEAAGDETALRHVLAHELTHYTHRDHLWGAVRCLCLALHWYNPLVWLAAVLSKRDGELACDEGAVERLGESERIPYGRTLVGLVARLSAPADLLSCSTAMTGSGKTVRQRIELLVKHPRTVRTALIVAVAVLALCLVCAFAGGKSAAGTYGDYMDRLEQAQSIRIGEPPTSSSFASPEPISDPGLLAEARELLARAEPLEDAEEIENMWLYARTVTLTDGAGLNSVYRLGTSGSRCYLAEAAENWDDPFIPFAVLPGETNAALDSVAQRQADLAGSGTSVDLSGAGLSALDLAHLLVDSLPNDYAQTRNELSVPFTETWGDRTLLLVQYPGLAHADGFDNLAAGVWDSESGEFLPGRFTLGGDDARYTAWTEADGSLYLLCANTVTFQGRETSVAPLWLRFQDGELTRITTLPAVARTAPAGEGLPGDEIFFRNENDYWVDHKIIPGEGGFTLYERSADFQTPPQEQWSEVGFVPLTVMAPGEENAAVSRDPLASE